MIYIYIYIYKLTDSIRAAESLAADRVTASSAAAVLFLAGICNRGRHLIGTGHIMVVMSLS